ncbi:retrovirus-related pol polyprotein from transposon TNT 1-94 [Tanacetum coccineum]
MDHKRVIDELTQGKEFAKQLMIHLDNPLSSYEVQEILIHSILKSYDKSLSLLKAHGLSPVSHSHGGMGITRLESQPPFVASPHREDSGRELKNLDHKDVSAKRIDNEITGKWKVKVRGDMGFEEALDDGYSWRKYGQKDILGAKHPRGYYRCAYRLVEGCLATKQVQKVDKEPNIFDITYRGSHTCNPGSHQESTSPSLPVSTPRPETQQAPQQNQFVPSPETLLEFQTSPTFMYENLETRSFQFPSTSNKLFNILPLVDDIYDDPTACGSISNAMTVESELHGVVSPATSPTSSQNVDVGFRFGELDFGKVLEKFNMKDAEARCQPLGDHFKLSKKQAAKTEAARRRMVKVPYASAVGRFLYAMMCTRTDIPHAVGIVSRFISNTGKEHWKAVKWLIRYLKGTSKATLCFNRNVVVLEGFSNSDYRGCLDSGNSLTVYVFTVGGITVSSMSRIQKCVAMSTTEAEYMDTVEAGKELVWLKNFLEELDRAQIKVRAVALLKESWFEVYRDYLRRRAVK